MIIRCTATALVVRGTPGGVDLKQRLNKGETATVVGRSLSDAWLYITNDKVTGWVAWAHVEEVAHTAEPTPAPHE